MTQKYSLILKLVIIIVLCSLMIIFVISSNQPNETSTNNSVINSNPDEEFDSEITFQLRSINMGSPDLNVQRYKLNSLVSQNYTLDINDSNGSIFTENAELFIFIGLGETGGLRNGIQLDSTIESAKLNIPIFKAKSDEQYLYNAGDFDSKFQSFFYYVDEFKSGKQCEVLGVEYDTCSDQEITLNSIESSPRIGIYCAAIDEVDSLFCDEFVKNLEITILN